MYFLKLPVLHLLHVVCVCAHVWTLNVVPVHRVCVSQLSFNPPAGSRCSPQTPPRGTWVSGWQPDTAGWSWALWCRSPSGRAAPPRSCSPSELQEKDADKKGKCQGQFSSGGNEELFSDINDLQCFDWTSHTNLPASIVECCFRQMNAC